MGMVEMMMMRRRGGDHGGGVVATSPSALSPSPCGFHRYAAVAAIFTRHSTLFHPLLLFPLIPSLPPVLPLTRSLGRAQNTHGVPRCIMYIIRPQLYSAPHNSRYLHNHIA